MPVSSDFSSNCPTKSSIIESEELELEFASSISSSSSENVSCVSTLPPSVSTVFASGKFRRIALDKDSALAYSNDFSMASN